MLIRTQAHMYALTCMCVCICICVSGVTMLDKLIVVAGSLAIVFALRWLLQSIITKWLKRDPWDALRFPNWEVRQKNLLLDPESGVHVERNEKFTCCSVSMPSNGGTNIVCIYSASVLRVLPC